MNQFAISTSTLSGQALLQGGFGPVTPDGYGIGYICRGDFMAFWVSGFKVRNTNFHKVEIVKNIL